MWEWLLTESKRLANLFYSTRVQDREDLISDVLLNLVSHKSVAAEIYETKNVAYLYTVIKNEVFTRQANQMLYSKSDLFYYIEIVKISKQYSIDIKVENAYLFSAIIANPVLSICRIASILMSVKPFVCSLDEMIEREARDNGT